MTQFILFSDMVRGDEIQISDFWNLHTAYFNYSVSCGSQRFFRLELKNLVFAHTYLLTIAMSYEKGWISLDILCQAFFVLDDNNALTSSYQLPDLNLITSRHQNQFNFIYTETCCGFRAAMLLRISHPALLICCDVFEA